MNIRKQRVPLVFIIVGLLLLTAYVTGRTPEELFFVPQKPTPTPTITPTPTPSSLGSVGVQSGPTIPPTPTLSEVLGEQQLSIDNASLYSVTRVVDGDTIEVTKDGVVEKVRMIGINSPESVDPRRHVECFGKEASLHLKQLIEGKIVRLATDETQQDRDRYGRILRYVFLDDRNINEQMIWDGYAYEYTYALPYRYQAEFRLAEQEAQKVKAGLWASDTCQGKK